MPKGGTREGQARVGPKKERDNDPGRLQRWRGWNRALERKQKENEGEADGGRSKRSDQAVLKNWAYVDTPYKRFSTLLESYGDDREETSLINII